MIELKLRKYIDIEANCLTLWRNEAEKTHFWTVHQLKLSFFGIILTAHVIDLTLLGIQNVGHLNITYHHNKNLCHTKLFYLTMLLFSLTS